MNTGVWRLAVIKVQLRQAYVFDVQLRTITNITVRGLERKKTVSPPEGIIVQKNISPSRAKSVLDRSPSRCRIGVLCDETFHVLVRNPVDVDALPVVCQHPDDVLYVGVECTAAKSEEPVSQNTRD